MCRTDILRLHQLGELSIFETTLEAGLSALKTHQCFYQNLRSDACPVCSNQLNAIAKRLPYSHCTQVKIIVHSKIAHPDLFVSIYEFNVFSADTHISASSPILSTYNTFC